MQRRLGWGAWNDREPIAASDAIAAPLATLRRDGVARLPGLVEPASLEAVRAELACLVASGSSLLPISRDRGRDPSDLDRRAETLSAEETARGERHFRELTNYVHVRQPFHACPSIVPLVFHPALIALASAYIGGPAAVGGLNIRKSYANDVPAFDTLRFHSDPNSPRFVKFFFYLNDVDERGGPFAYIAGSHRRKFPGWKRRTRWTDEELAGIYGAERLRTFPARLGDVLVADTTGFHRGSKPLDRDRAMLTVNYVIHPEFQGSQPRAMFKLPLAALRGLSPAQRAAADLLYASAAGPDEGADAPPPAPPGQPLSRLEAARRAGRLAATSLRQRARRRRRRDARVVARGYDEGSWKQVLDEARWKRCDTLRDFVVAPDDAPRTAMVEQRLVETSTRDYYAYRLAMLTSQLVRLAGDVDALCELGSGAGLNLLSLALSGRWKELRGFDVSPNGVAATRAAAQHFGLTSVEAELLDLTDGDAPSWEKLRDAVCFSYFCLEQLPHDTDRVLDRLLAARPRRVIHFENSVDALEPWRPQDLATLAHVVQNDYQRRLLGCLRERERRGALRILLVERPGFAPMPRNDPTLICWEPV